MRKDRKKVVYSDNDKEKENSVDRLTSKYGTPDEIIVANQLKTDDANGVILVYREKGMMVINGQPIMMKEIKEVMIKNENNPYMLPDYQIRVVTSLEDYPYLFIETGSVALWAEEVLNQIQDELQA